LRLTLPAGAANLHVGAKDRQTKRSAAYLTTRHGIELWIEDAGIGSEAAVLEPLNCVLQEQSFPGR
jgi:hypothetical protein